MLSVVEPFMLKDSKLACYEMQHPNKLRQWHLGSRVWRRAGFVSTTKIYITNTKPSLSFNGNARLKVIFEGTRYAREEEERRGR
jgi:hypothetical protein